jgi:TfoX/Sxy family transcriptional regulator of competence genes
MIDSSHEKMRDELSAAVLGHPSAGELRFRAMFGGLSGYIGSRVFASMSNVGLALKLSEVDQAGLLAIEGAERLRYEPSMPPSKQYIVVPASIRSEDTALAHWTSRSVEYVLTLPAPKPKPAKTSK